MVFVFLFFCALFIVGFEYFSHHGMGSLKYGQLLWLIVPGLGVASALSFLLRIRSVKRALGSVSMRSVAALFLSPMLLVALYALMAANLFLHYEKTGVTSELLVLMAGMLLAQGVWIWKEWMRQQGKMSDLSHQMIMALIAALAMASIFHPDWSTQNQLYEYRGVTRWTGPVKDPNHFGLLMALGLVLAIGLAFLRVLGRIQKSKFPAHVSDGEPRLMPKSRKIAALPGLLLYLSIILLGLALLKSYSRGGWLSTLVGVGYLIWSGRKIALAGGMERFWEFSEGPAWVSKWWPRLSRFLRENAVSLLLIAVSTVVISYYCFRHTEVRVVRRVFSPGNVYDFSWQNRVVAYKGALQIMADNPWSGLGWGQQEVQYNEYYRLSRLTEGYAILLNDYLTVGMILGLPALGCLVGYGWLAFKNSGASRRIQTASETRIAVENENDEKQWRESWLQTTCRAGVLVLLVGFWFDHGLLMVPLGLPFWLLLELGRGEPDLVKADLIRSGTTLDYTTDSKSNN